MTIPSLQRIFTLLAGASSALLLSNCTVGTPQSRIEANHSLYESIPAKHQALVSQGKIAKGMSKSAVFLALGDPSRKTEGFRDNTKFERWDYSRLQPIYTSSFHSFYGHGYGRYGRGRYHGFGFAPTIQYAPYRSASVIFHRDVVDSWEKLGPHRY